MATAASTSSNCQRALELAKSAEKESISALADVVRIRSLTGEEGPGQAHMARLLRDLNADVSIAEPDTAALFERFPAIAQYPTHWQHDLILPYAVLPTYAELRRTNLDTVLNYRDRPNITGVFRGTGGGRSLILNGHIDTVTIEPASAWTRDPFGGEVADGIMYGRGTSDMKGGVMAALLAITYLRRAGADLRGDVIFQCVVNEEHAGNGTLDLVRRGITADAAIVLEPTRNTVSVAHPGGLYWQVTVPGRSRSPGARWVNGRQEGVSAIEKLPNIVKALTDLEARYNAASVNGHAPFSLVIGKVQGGHYETVTAGELVLRGGAYFAPGAGDIEQVMAAFREAIAQANASDEFLSEHPAKLEFLHHDDSTFQRADIAVATEMCRVLRERDRPADVLPGPFCCDMRHLVNQGGIPSIIFGPGTIAQAHKPDEHIELREFLDCIEHLITFMWSWCNQDRATIRQESKTGNTFNARAESCAN